MCVLLGEIIFLKLAWWQYNRMLEKNEIQYQAQLLMKEESFEIPASQNNREWRRAEAWGFVDTKRAVLLDNVMNDHRVAGMRVFAPFMISADEEIVVDLGWVKRSYDSEYLSNILFETDDAHQIKGVLRAFKTRSGWLEGSKYGVHEGIVTLPTFDAVPLEENILRETFYLQAEQYDSKHIKAGIEQPKSSDKHLEYLITWLTFATVLISMYAYLIFRVVQNNKR